ncbi:Helix-turn-helix domain of resolvase [Arthrobacter sp. ov118]|nr:helix-turn-helix domain-containing protein [Arthrobacter sp. ov118]SFT92426.1 Helix-turn-helix domain of resolvase [Arthrobacter sp. ov118]
MTDSKIRSARKLLSEGTPPKKVAKILGVPVPTLYRWVPATTSETENIPVRQTVWESADTETTGFRRSGGHPS